MKMRRPWRWVPAEGTNLGFFVDADDNILFDFGDETQYYPTAGTEPSLKVVNFILNCVNSVENDENDN